MICGVTAHISAEPGDIAETVLMPGDPLRAKWMAETYLTDPVQYTAVRNMYGYTGTYKGHRLSIQGSGMGQPSASIYAHELLAEFGARTLVRVGSAGAMTKDLNLRDVVAAIGATTDSAMNRVRFNGLFDYAPVADFGLLRNSVDVATEKGKTVHVGPIFSADTFYSDNAEMEAKLSEYGVLAVEMEAAALYTLAAKFKARALCLVTISDHLITKEVMSSEDRERSFADMAEIALETVIR